MTRINFYEVEGGFETTLSLACRLAEKAFRQRTETLLFCPDQVAAEQLSALLWKQSDTSFLAHQLITEKSAQDHPSTVVSAATIAISSGEDVPEHHGTLINLATETPDWFGRFETLAEIVNTNPEQREYKRQRYRFYRDRGYPLAYHNLSGAPLEQKPAAEYRQGVA